MINTNSVSSTIHPQFNLPSNSHNHSFNQSSSHQFPFNFSKIHITNPSISTKKTPNFLPKSSSAVGFYSPSSEETLYELLGISETGTLSEIKRAYKQLALKYHPDVSPPGRVDEYTMRFIRVQEAYETLSDPESRAMYDVSMAKGLPLGFSGKKTARSEWKQSWQVQLEELKRRSAVDHGGRVSWAARIRKKRGESEVCGNGSGLD